MSSPIKRRFVIGAAGLAVAAGGGGIAIAASGGGSDERSAYLKDAAGRLNVTPDKLEDALKGAFDDRLDQAVKDGRLTQQQADQIKADVDKRGVPIPGAGPGGGPGFGGHGFGGHRGGPWPTGAGGPTGRGGPSGQAGPGGRAFRGGFGPGAGPGFGFFGAELQKGLAVAADDLGVSTDQLRKDVFSGQSLADVAKAQGKDTGALKAKLTDFAKSELDAAVTSGKVPQAMADRVEADLGRHISDLVDGKHPAFRHGRFGGPPPGP